MDLKEEKQNLKSYFFCIRPNLQTKIGSVNCPSTVILNAAEKCSDQYQVC